MICYLVAVLIGVCDFPPKKWGSLPERLLFSTRRSGMQFPGILGFVRLKDQLGISTKSLQFHFCHEEGAKKGACPTYKWDLLVAYIICRITKELAILGWPPVAGRVSWYPGSVMNRDHRFTGTNGRRLWFRRQDVNKNRGPGHQLSFVQPRRGSSVCSLSLRWTASRWAGCCWRNVGCCEPARNGDQHLQFSSTSRSPKNADHWWQDQQITRRRKDAHRITRKSRRKNQWLWSSWWFQRFFIFTPIWGNDPIWLIFFRWVGSTTN